MNTFAEPWAAISTAPALNFGDVHVWRACLEVNDSQLETFREVLSSDEIVRSERSPLLQERNRFVAGRGLLRHILSAYLDVDPAEISFAYGYAGKPYLADAASKIRFNMSHSGDIALIAITQHFEVGVDVERICELPEMDEIVTRFFSAEAKTAFQSANLDDRTDVFFKFWTQKEAALKCTGQGIADEEPVANDSLSIISLAPAPGYAGALATTGAMKHVRTFSWSGTCAIDTSACVTSATGVFL
jgi:4'-phosphopantetheinyl transferase